MTYLEEQIARTKTMVQRWHGCDAKMYELSRSHRTLTIVICGHECGKNLVVSLMEPLFINGPTSWAENEASIVTVTLETGNQFVEFVDHKNKVRIVAESFEVAENRKV
ncbi:hypothetical protein [Planctopirus hydrillae]|nr:hypothetical protein [Planctopirus hydrillae]